VHLRRALLLFALVLGLTGLAASIAPPPEGGDDKAVAPPPAPSPEAAEEQRTVRFRAPPKGDKPLVRRVEPNTRILVEVASRRPGQVSLPALGRIENATELVPARFELLAPEPGRYEVLFEPTGGSPVRVGTLVSGR
jgi:hypothetical protein